LFRTLDECTQNISKKVTSQINQMRRLRSCA
jgi:hypothetical protein